MHEFTATKSKGKMICAKFEICRKSLEKNFELLRVNTSFHMRVKHPFINEVNWPSQNLALITEFRTNKKRMEPWVEGNEKNESQQLAKVNQWKSLREFQRATRHLWEKHHFHFALHISLNANVAPTSVNCFS